MENSIQLLIIYVKTRKLLMSTVINYGIAIVIILEIPMGKCTMVHSQCTMVHFPMDSYFDVENTTLSYN